MKTITFDDTVWKLVPITPTREMLTATLDMGNTSYDNHQYILTEHWKDMLAAAPTQEHAPSQSFDEVWGSIDWNEWRMKSIRDLVQMIHSKTTAVPAEIDVRTILLDIAPGDGNGYEVYAKNVDDVVAKLTEMGVRLEDAEAHTPAVPSVQQGWVEQMLTDARHVFNARGPETPQETRDVIEYVASWIAAYRDNLAATPAPAPAVQQVEPNPDEFTVELIVTPMGGFAPITTHGVRVTHKPTGLTVSCDTERSQHRNKHIAFEKLRAMLATTSDPDKVPAQGSWVAFSNSIGIGVTAVGGSDVAWTRCERFGLHDGSRSRAEDEANARVMAAARELLDAADMALNTLLGCCIAMGGVDDRKTMLEAQQKLRKAIRKANGGP